METLSASKEAVLKEFEEGNKKQKSSLIRLFTKKPFVKDIMEVVTSMETALDYNDETMEQFLERTKDMDPFDWSMACQKAFAFAINEHVNLTTEDTWYRPYYRRSGSGFSFGDWAVSHSVTGASVGSRLCVNRSDKAIHMDKCIGNIIIVGLTGEHTPETKLLQHPKTNKS